MLNINNLTGFKPSGVTGTSPPSVDLFVWGNNTYGQTGNDNTSVDPITKPTNTDTTEGIFVPTKSCSMAQHMGYLIGDEIYTCGLNQYGQLGHNNTTNLDEFTKVTTNNGDITDFALGESHTLLVKDDEVYGCGRNNVNQLTSSQGSIEKKFELLFENSTIQNRDAIKVYASRNSGAVLTSIGQVYTWGANLLSAGGSTNATPVNLENFFSEDNREGDERSSEPYYVDVGMGDTHMVLLTDLGSDQGNLFTISSDNTYGQQGNGTTNSNSSKFFPSEFGQFSITRVAAGRYTSYVIAGGKLFAAGRGDNGEMGAATTEQVNTDWIEIGGDITDWVEVQAGGGYVIAQRQNGELYHSGINSHAEQGNGSTGSDEFGFVLIDGGGDGAKSYDNFTTARRTIYGVVEV